MPSQDLFASRADIPRHAMERFDILAEYRDLCSNCDNGSECAGRTRPRRPIFFCEQFEVFGAVPAPELDRAVQAQQRKPQNSNGHLGLCVNCDNASTCVSSNPPGGVWHCEEYR